MKKIAVIIQSRISSSRLPAKAMLDLVGKTLLERVIDRVKLAKSVHTIMVATSRNREDDLIEWVANKNEIAVYRGQLDNVLSRYCEAAKMCKADITVRVTADNPFTEPSYIDQAVEELLKNDYDYVAYKNCIIGTAVEAFTNESLMEIYAGTYLSPHNIEHVTSYYYQHTEKYKIKYIDAGIMNECSVTVDTLNDYEKVYKFYSELISKEVEQEKYLEYLKKSLVEDKV